MSQTQVASSSQSALHYEQGKLCYQSKKFQDAIFQFTEAIRLKPDTTQAAARCHNARGVVYFYLGEFKKVIKDCSKALELDPNNANYHNCRGNAYFSLGKFAKAAEDFTKAIELSPEASHGRYYNNRGSAYRRLKMFKEAIDDYTKAISVDPKNGNYYNNRGNTYFDMGEFQLAINDFSTALGLEPYSPKTKLTLAQAREALAQEKRMKNATQYKGIFSSIKTKTVGKGKVQKKRKERPCDIYVSPAGVEITFVRGWRKKKSQQSFQWSEDMKIELVDDSHVKLFLDGSRMSWIVITPCDATAVEEELIGRITTKFASYSTACLVAQHEGVVQEYTDIVKGIKDAQQQLNLLETIHGEALKQMDGYSKDKNFDLANKSKEQVQKLDQQIKDKQSFIDSEIERAEVVRQRAEQEAGPVLDMVLIMQNRVRELYQTQVKSVKGKYKVDDLELEEQLNKMEQLVQRANELGTLVSRPVYEIVRAVNVPSAQQPDDSEEHEEADEEEEEWNADFEKESEKDEDSATAEKPAPSQLAEKSTPPAKKVSAAAAAAAAPASASAAAAASRAPAASKPPQVSAASSTAGEDSEESDWDDIDEDALPPAFMPSGNEIFMSLESGNGMVTITPHALGTVEGGVGDIVMMKRGSIVELDQEKKALEEKVRGAYAEAEDARSKLAEQKQLETQLLESKTTMSQLQNELENVRRKFLDAEAASANQVGKSEEQMRREREAAEALERQLGHAQEQLRVAHEKVRERDEAVKQLEATQQQLESMKAERERLQKLMQQKETEMEGEKRKLTEFSKMSSAEKEEQKRRMGEQEEAYKMLQRDLAAIQTDLGMAAREAQEKGMRLQELEQSNFLMQQKIEEMSKMTAEEKVAQEKREQALKKQVEAMMSSANAVKEELETTKREKMQLSETVEQQAMSLSELRKHLQKMKEELERANEEQRKKAAALEQLEEAKRAREQEINVLKEQARKEELKRRELHNLIQEIKGNIRVYIRIRPKIKQEDTDHVLFEDILGSDGKGMRLVAPAEVSSTGGKVMSKKWEFEFDRVFWPNSAQADVFGEISQLVQSALDGYKVCIFAYGQTGSGKTFTMEGPPDGVADHRGMIPRSVEQIFTAQREMQEKGWEYSYHVSFLEIYNQTIRDLLVVEDNEEHEIKMVKDEKKTVTIVTNLRVEEVKSSKDLTPLLKMASEQRSSASTMSNDRSSRSHSVFQLRIRGLHKESGQESNGMLNLIDLAGSERVDKSKVTGQRLEETKAINSSLTCLGDVIAALANGAKHVPFRNSKLTFLLQDSFGGGSKTLMFINVASELEHMNESLCSLRFGAKVHECHIGQGKKNIKAAPEEKKAAPK